VQLPGCFGPQVSSGAVGVSVDAGSYGLKGAPTCSSRGDWAQWRVKFEGSSCDAVPSGVLGQGTMSVVRRGFDTQCDGAAIAVKQVKKTYLENSDVDIIRAEIKLQGRLAHHANVVGLHGSYETDDTINLVLEYAGEGSLQDRMKRVRRLPEGEMRRVTHDILQGLDFLHRKERVVHCDIKPHNIVFGKSEGSEEGEVVARLCDFGLARSLPSVDEGDKLPAIGVRGTPGFIAPELFRDEEITPAVDMWSLGVMLFRILGGYAPFRGADACVRQLEMPDRFWKSVSPEARDLIQGLCVRDASQRLTAAQALNHPWLTPASV